MVLIRGRLVRCGAMRARGRVAAPVGDRVRRAHFRCVRARPRRCRRTPPHPDQGDKPMNQALNHDIEKIGVRKTLLRIMVGWGVVAVAMMFVQTPTQFDVLRFLLGAFEAGFTPGVLLYLTYWYPPARRARMMAIFLLGALVAS